MHIHTKLLSAGLKSACYVGFVILSQQTLNTSWLEGLTAFSEYLELFLNSVWTHRDAPRRLGAPSQAALPHSSDPYITSALGVMGGASTPNTWASRGRAMLPDHWVLPIYCSSSWKWLVIRERILNASHVCAFESTTKIPHPEEWQTKNTPLLTVE